MKKEPDLKIGDIVIITNASNIYTIGLLLGYETISLKMFYRIDSIWRDCCLDKEYLKKRMDLALKRAKNIANIEFHVESLLRVSRNNKCRHITELGADEVKTWYLKNRLIDKSLPVLYEKEDLLTHSTVSKENLVLGSVLKTPVSNIYYIYTGVGTKYVKLNEDEYELMKSGIYYPDSSNIVERLSVNRMILLQEHVGETELQFVFPRFQN